MYLIYLIKLTYEMIIEYMIMGRLYRIYQDENTYIYKNQKNEPTVTAVYLRINYLFILFM